MASLLKRREMDLTSGSIIKKLILFAIPIILTNMIDRLFNMTDTIMLGMMVSDKAVGAVSAASTIDVLLIDFFLGISGGVSVVVARHRGAKDLEGARRTVGTSLLICLIGGVFIGTIGFFGAETFLIWTNCDKTLMPLAVKYMKIYCAGIPIILLYNCIAGILRAVGDSVRPLMFLTLGGFINIFLNGFFIIVCGLTVEGVAIGTVGSRFVSLILAYRLIIKNDGFARFEYKHFKFYKKEIGQVLAVGVPTGIQSCLFGLSNVFVSSSVNSLGAAATTGVAISKQLDAWSGTIGKGFAVGTMSFVSQNYGAKNFKRIKEAIIKAIIMVALVQFSVGVIIYYLISPPFFSMMSSNPEVIKFAVMRNVWFSFFYFLCGMYEVFALSMRAIGKSLTSMFISLIFVGAFRVIWLNTIFLLNPTFDMIFCIYPISWIMCMLVQVPIIISTLKKKEKQYNDEKNQIEQVQSV